MFDKDRWSELWQVIARNKARSIMTAFGVFWGIFMLVILASSGNGLQNGIYDGVKDFASNTCVMWTNRTAEAYKGFRKDRSWSMKIEDVDAIKEHFPMIKYVSPILWGNNGGSGNNVFYQEQGGSFGVEGKYPDYDKISKSKILAGRYINDLDILHYRKVCLIGERVRKTIFPHGEDPIGKSIKVNGIYVQVVGVLDATNNNMISLGGRPEETVVIPYTTMQRVYNMGNQVYFVAITANDNQRIGSLEEDINLFIKKRHEISPTDRKALGGFNIEKQFTMFNYLFLGVNTLVWIVGMGILAAGIIGVSNIMVVTVKERTKEIGVRRALGATPTSIIMQIMMESLVLTSLAGLLGMVAGVGVMAGVDKILSAGAASSNMFFKSPIMGFFPAVMATIVIIASGMLAGLIPAMRAMKIKAIDAIREE